MVLTKGGGSDIMNKLTAKEAGITCGHEGADEVMKVLKEKNF